MKYKDYLKIKNKFKMQINAGLAAERELPKAVYQRQKRKLLKIVNRGKRAHEKLVAGVVF
jgi:hypothetical protein